MARHPSMARHEHHLANVHHIRTAPSAPPTLFDQETERDASVRLSRLEAQLIASLLKTAQSHLPSPRAVDDAIELLTGVRP